MFMLAHKDDCAIVVKGPTEESGPFSVADGRGGWNEIVRAYPTACSCGGVLVQVDLMVYPTTSTSRRPLCPQQEVASANDHHGGGEILKRD